MRDKGCYRFGPFGLDTASCVLLRDGAPVKLPPRLYATLLHLVENADRVVAHEELRRAVWGGRVVDDANIKQTIFTLRKTLQGDGAADRLIVTVPLRGYMFAGGVSFEPEHHAPVSVPEPASPPPAALPRRRTPWRRATVLGLALIAPAVAWLAYALAPRSFDPPPHSVAVLPFINLPGDPAQQYFSDGIADELISALSRIGAMHVAARSSAFSFKGKPTTVTRVGRALNVGAVLEGSVRRDGPHVRVTAELVSTRTGYTMWSGSFDPTHGDMLQVQGDIAAAVTAALQVSLVGAEAARFTLGGTDDEAALDAYLRGMKRAQGDVADIKLSLADFDEAIARDPNFAIARTQRSHALNVIATSDTGSDLAAVQHTLGQAITEADRAVAIAPGLGLAHLARAQVLLSMQDFADAETELSVARSLAPGDARITMAYAFTQLQFGHIEAGVAAAQQAAALDPLTPGTYLALASALYRAGRFDEVRAAIRRAHILGDSQGASAFELALALDHGDYAAVLRPCAAGHDFHDLICLARAYHGLGRQAEAQAELDRLRALLGDNGAYQYAEIYAQWGQIDQAVHWLQTAYRLHDTGLALMKSDPLLAPIRTTAQYLDIERRLDFPSF